MICKNCNKCKISNTQDCLICNKRKTSCEKCHQKDIDNFLNDFFYAEEYSSFILLNNSNIGEWLQVILQDKHLFCDKCLKFGLYSDSQIDFKNPKFVRLNYLLKLRKQFKK